jgi:ATP-dependent protease ClpP protease subunit
VSKRVFMAAVKSSVLEILIYDEIGENYWTGGGITASSVASAIKAAGTFSSISLRVNSPGGSCFDGVAIFNLLRAQGKPIEVFVDGIAASAASVIAMAGDTINIGVGAMLMIHNAMWGAYGDAQALRTAADAIETISVTVGEIYVQRSKKDAAAVKALMDAETWMNGAQAVEQGFADKVVNQDDAQAAQSMALARKFNLKAFQHAPEEWKKGKPHASVNTECECDCSACQDVGCSGCENDPCEAEGCDCPNHEEMSSDSIPDLEIYKHRLALREHSA